MTGAMGSYFATSELLSDMMTPLNHEYMLRQCHCMKLQADAPECHLPP